VKPFGAWDWINVQRLKERRFQGRGFHVPLVKLNETFKKGMGINPFDLTFGSKSFSKCTTQKIYMKQFLLETYI